jgi:hypothetical protein
MRYNWGNMFDDWDYTYDTRYGSSDYRNFKKGKEIICLDLKAMIEIAEKRELPNYFAGHLPEWIETAGLDALIAFGKYVKKREAIFQKRQELERLVKQHQLEQQAFEIMIKNGVIEE